MSEERLQQQSGGVRLEREIGQGAYGTVYLAVGPSGERAAVKLYRAIPHQEGLSGCGTSSRRNGVSIR